MDWKGLLNSVGGIAATVLAVPTGGLSTAVWGVAKKLTGMSDDSEESRDKAAKIIAADPELQLKFSLEMKRLSIEETKLELQKHQQTLNDINSARNMAINLKGTKQAWMQPIMSVLGIASFFAAFYLLYTQDLPEDGRDLIMMMVGWLGATYKDVYQFYFGSSQSNKD